MSARVLVIDSRPDEAGLVAGWLKEHFTAEVASEPEAVWQRLAEGQFDALLLEDGLLPTRRVLRRLEEGRNLGCFLVLFGDPSPQRALDAVSAGAFAFLLRPLSRTKVGATLRRGLRNRKKLLDIMSMSRDLHQANRTLTEQKRRLQEEKRHLAAKSRQLNLMNELSCAASASLDPARIVSAVGTRLARELPLDSWAVLFAPSGGEQATLFTPGCLSTELAQALGRQLIERLARAGGRPSGLGVHPLSRRTIPRGLAARTAAEEGLVLPLLAAGEVIGLYKLLPCAPLGRDLVRLAESAANMVALGLRNAGELIAARRQADHDGLTRIANRRAFERQLRQEFSRSRRYSQPLTLVMADIDHFKQVNDRYGHQVGDRVLAQVARALSGAVRECDFVARYGGEEFAMILPQTGLESSLALVRRVKRLVEDRRPVAKAAHLRLTLSMGLADTGAPQAEEAPDLVRLADHALYLSKTAGRNRIMTWRDITEMEVPLPGPVGGGRPAWQPWEA